jgi:hypothetical protein
MSTSTHIDYMDSILFFEFHLFPIQSSSTVDFDYVSHSQLQPLVVVFAMSNERP